jgi:predicted nuclease of predicted toxin-antitoxin system
MKVLFDNATPRKLNRFLSSRHTVTEARARGWAKLKNGDLLQEAEAAGFDVLVTPDKNMRYQQNLTGRKIALVVLGQGTWPRIEAYVAQIVAAVNAATPGSFAEVDIPLPPKWKTARVRIP